MSPYRERQIRRTYWNLDWKKSNDSYEEEREERWLAEEPEATLIASLTTEGLHAPAIDIDHPVRFRLGIGGGSLFFKAPAVKVRHWRRLLKMLNRCGLLTETRFRDDLPSMPRIFGRLDPMPPLPIDATLTLVPSTSPGHFHLYIEKELRWDDYLRLLKAFVKAGLVEKAYCRSAARRGMTMLVKPGMRNPRKPLPNDLAPPF